MDAAARGDDVVATSDQEDFDAGGFDEDEVLFHLPQLDGSAGLEDGQRVDIHEVAPETVRPDEDTGKVEWSLTMERHQGAAISTSGPSSPSATVPLPSTTPSRSPSSSPRPPVPAKSRLIPALGASSESDDDIDMLTTRERRRRLFDDTQPAEATSPSANPHMDAAPKTPPRVARAGSLPPIWPSPEHLTELLVQETERSTAAVLQHDEDASELTLPLPSSGIRLSQLIEAEDVTPPVATAVEHTPAIAAPPGFEPHHPSTSRWSREGSPAIPRNLADVFAVQEHRLEEFIGSTGTTSLIDVDQGTLFDVQRTSPPRRQSPSNELPARPHTPDGAMNPPTPPMRTQSRMSTSSTELSDLPPSLSPVALAPEAGPSRLRDSPKVVAVSPRTAAALEAAQQEQPGRPARSLRARNPSQLNPYQIEAQRYAAALLRNDWEDALVGQRSVRVQEKLRVAEEDREARIARSRDPNNGAGADGETQDWLVDDMGSSDESVYTEVSDGHGGKRRTARRRRESSSDGNDKENQSPSKILLDKERRAAKRRRREERLAAAKERPDPTPVHHPGIKRARPVAPPPRPRSPPRQYTEDLSYLLPQSDEEAGLYPSVGSTLRRTLPQFVQDRMHKQRGSGSDSSSNDVLNGRRRGRSSGRAYGADTDSQTSDGDVGATSGIQPTGLFDDSSADEARVVAMRRGGSSGSKKPRNRDDSDSEAEYRSLFKDLRKMMPIHMARKYIEDVKNMRKGKAYHSDGHVSSTPDPSSADEAGRSSLLDRSHQRSTPATSPPPETEEVRPGEARKRMAPRADDNANSSRFALIGDSDSSDSDAAPPSVLSISSDSSAHERPQRTRDSDTDQSDRDERWWTRPTSGATRQYRRPKDSIDLLLSRAGGKKRSKRSRAQASRRGQGSSRQSKLDEVGVRRVPPGFGQAPRDGQEQPTKRRAGPPTKHKRLRQTHLHIVRDQRPTIDLLDDDALFEFDMPAQREEEFAFLNPVTTNSEPRSPVVTADASTSIQREGPGPGTPAALNMYMQRSIGPLTPATTVVPSLGSFDAPHPGIQQPIQVIPPLRQEPPVDQRTVRGAPTTPGHARPSTPSSALGGGAAVHSHMEAESWASYRRLRIDFGIEPLPSGLSFDVSSYLGRGHLAELLKVADESEPTPQDQGVPSISTRLCAFGLDLQLDMSVQEMLDNLPSLFDAMLIAILPEANDTAASSLGLRASAEDALTFLGRFLSRVANGEESRHLDVLFEALKSHLCRSCQRLDGMAKLGSQAHAKAALSLRWFTVQYAWRGAVGSVGRNPAACHGTDFLAELSTLAQTMMLHLAKHGIHRTFRTIRAAIQANYRGEVVTLSDLTAELWICLVHVLNAVKNIDPEAEKLCSFWSVFEAANKCLIDRAVKRQRLGASERTWYSIFAISALSQFSAASGKTVEQPALAPHWSMVTFALSLVRFRFDEKTEKTMSSTSVQRRDAYIRVILQRCLTLSSRWGWRLDTADITLSRLFDIFNSHKLCNLPSEVERTHDYPTFLCKYDESHLKHLTPEDLGESHSHGPSLVFHVFVKLVARAAYDLRAGAASDVDAQRKISRLFSRMSPVRTMPFTRASPPTSIERSILFNHYTMVLVYLLFVPSTANQRLRQIKSFLPFSGADIASQMTCIRAMLYIGVLFRHHDLPLQPVTSWFSEALPMLVQQHEALERQRLSSSKTGPYKDWTATAIYRELRSTSTLLIAALRAIQHILKNPSLEHSASDRPAAYPDLQLLQADWIKTVLEGQVAIDPAIGREAMNTIQEFLKQRNQVIAATQAPKARGAGGNVQRVDGRGESQDSFAGMFDDDDMLMDDPILASMLGEVAPAQEGARGHATPATLQAKDAAFAQLIKGTISPALFRLLSNVYHPDRAKAGKRISLSFDPRLVTVDLGRPLREQRMLLEQQRSRQRYVELVVDCWAGCADVLVRNGLRDWDQYISSFGDESWKRIIDPIGRRDVGLRFLNTALLRDPAAYELYEAEFVSMWFQASVSRLLSIQDKYTRTLLEIDGDGPIFSGMPWARDPESGLVGRLRDTDFLKHRLTALHQAFDNLRQEFARSNGSGTTKSSRKPMIFASMSAMLAAMRQNVDDTPMHHPDRKEYLRFCLSVVQGMKERLGAGIMRGAGAEVTALESHLVSLGAKLPVLAEANEKTREPGEASALPNQQGGEQEAGVAGGLEDGEAAPVGEISINEQGPTREVTTASAQTM